jgi:hypothetical protein
MYRRIKVYQVVFVMLVIIIGGAFPLQAAEGDYQLNDINYYRVENVYYIENGGLSTAKDITLDIVLGNPYLTKIMPYSILLGSSCSPQPTQIVTDKKGNRKGKFTIPELKPRETRVIRIIQDYRVALINYEIQPENIGSCKLQRDTLSPYLLPSPGIESDNPLIQAKAREIVGEETNDFYKAKKIFAFLHEYMNYEYKERKNPKDKGALWALRTGKGVCEDYADLMVALLRASGIPSRTVAGWMGEVKDGSKNIANRNGYVIPGHMWLEYYLPGYGWIAADPTYTYLVNGESTVDFDRLMALKELRFAETSETEDHTVSYSFYGENVQVTYEINITNILESSCLRGDKTDLIVLYLEDVPLIFDVNPIIQNGRTLVPMRGIFQALGAEVNWDGATQKVIATTGERKVELQIGNRLARVNTGDITLDVAPAIFKDRTMIPLRFVGEALGCQVEWDGKKRSIELRFK